VRGVKLFEFKAEEPFGRYEVVCDGCGWKTRKIYVMAKTREEALELAKRGVFLCGECMAELIAEKQYEIL
jgi:hypothetical protein